MLHFSVSDVQATAIGSAGCMTCCCEKMLLKPGTTEKVSVLYASWAVPIGFLHCDPQFQIEQMETCPVPTPGAPQIISQDGMVRFDTGTNVVLNANFGDKIADPDGDPLVYKVLPLYGPRYGKLQLDPNGPFSYAPQAYFKGEERFYISVNDGKQTVNFEVLIAVGIDAGLMKPTPTLTVGKPSVDQRYYTVSFPITLSPAAQPCEVWRLTVLQNALDCDCTCFARTDCFDVHVAKC